MNKKQASQIRQGILQAKQDILFVSELNCIKNEKVELALLQSYIQNSQNYLGRLAERAYERTIEKERRHVKDTINEVKRFIEGHG